MVNKQLTELKSIIDNYENLKEKIFRVTEIADGTIKKVLDFSLGDNGDFEVDYEYSIMGERETGSEWFPMDLLDKSNDEIYDYFRERREIYDYFSARCEQEVK